MTSSNRRSDGPSVPLAGIRRLRLLPMPLLPSGWRAAQRALAHGTASRPDLDDRIRLPDGRRLAFAAYGDPRGLPVFWFHGTPGARLQIPPDAPTEAKLHGLRIIAVDRPGIGGSSHHRGRTLLSFAADVRELADQLGASRFGLIGLSGGGPYVLACAHQMPDRVTVGVSLGGVGPTVGEPGAPGYGPTLSTLMRLFGHVREPLGHVLSVAVQPFRPLVSPAFDLYVRYGPQEDRPVFEQEEMKEMFTQDIVMATRYGLRGPVIDVALFGQPWGFSPRDIRVPIRFYHGDQDTIVPLSHSVFLADLVPDSELTVMRGLGHFAGFVSMPEVLATVRGLFDEQGSE